ncbi:MAG TPA: UDP-N-acetylmuramoyl-L-alanine--D-glutamate ligase, partial [Burkholderiales bacterium]|nr:UDP-N-acetylmuramoyl-L-alanine--D-glutamate ligase [Burkholderiales bacterium]
GIDGRTPHLSSALRRSVPIVGDVEIFAQALNEAVLVTDMPHPKIIAITGSNGKSTVTAMTGEIASAADQHTIVAGNIGLPVLDALTRIEEGEAWPAVFVLELSSFQLETTAGLNADAATVLNVTEDHLDRYDGISEYAAAKARIFEGEGTQILNRADARVMRMARTGRACVTFGPEAPRNEREWGITDDAMLARGGERLLAVTRIPVAGRHNALNALAALALGDAIGLPMKSMLEGVQRFKGLPHRLEKVGEIHDVAFFDDSKGTNVGATVAALSGMSTPVVLIAGGDGKGQDFSPLAAAVSARARAVVLIGRDADRIEAALSGCAVPIHRSSSLEDAIACAYAQSQRHDAVLLSPACASYDMFRSYVHRGEMFVQGVHALAARIAKGAPW